ncbi:MAG: glycosyltransferase family 9 protein [Candidatus Aminicenantes bacterium]|nr:glycosyltransferase family 9 protein [Candidatus Aminicenantes bacterium]
MNSLIAVRRGGLGDLLVALPAVRLLRFAFPESRITLVSRPAYGCLFVEAGVVDAVEDADDFRWAALAGADEFLNREDLFLPEAGLVVGWFHSRTASDFKKGAAALLPGASIWAIDSDPLAGKPLSRSFFNQTTACIRRLNCPAAPFEECDRLTLPPRPAPRGCPARPYAVVHPGGGSRLKLWPGERFREIIRALAEAGLSGAVVLGEAETSLTTEWTDSSLPSGWILVDRPSLPDLAALLSGASYYLGNDSGVTHLAAVLGAPGLAVFRSEFAGAWHPGGKIDVISAEDVRDISVAAVLTRLDFSRSIR